MKFASILVLALFVLKLTRGDDSCPGLPTCFCNKDKTSVNCDGKDFAEVPDTIPVNVTKLYLRYNKIVTIKRNTFSRYVKLEKLYLNENKITEIEPQAFTGATALTMIDLRENKLASIGPNAFTGLPSLEELYLLTNNLERVDGKAFEGTEKIRYISLQANSFTMIPSLGVQPKLQRIILQSNSISDATFPESFSHSKELQYIGLSSNTLVTLHNETFKYLRNISVSSLYLSSNKLTGIEPGTFKHFAAITSLKLGHNPLDSIALKTALIGLEGQSIVSLDISGLRLNGPLMKDTFKLLLDTELTTLSMAYNNIPKLSNGSFEGLDDLLHLDISNCNIQKTDISAFVGLDKLQVLNMEKNKLVGVPRNLPVTLYNLYLDDNQIQIINSSVFRYQVHLLELRIRYNKILTLKEDSFLGLTSLTKLDLRYNIINTLPGTVFDPLVRLISLNLAQNKLFSIQNATKRFGSLGSLIYFNMADNNCEWFQRDMFKYMTSLKYLHLENNRLGGMISRDFSGELFKGLGKLQELYLMDNGITDLHAPEFQDLASLTLLNLTNNKIKTWDQNLFMSTPHLQFLDLTNNLVTVPKRENIDPLQNLAELNLTGNPFMCGCDLRWFRDWMNKTKVKLTNVESYTCTQPKEWAGKKLLSFDRTKINCLFFTWQVIVIVSASVAAFIMIIAVFLYRKRWTIKLYYYKKRYGRRTSKLARDGRGNYGAINEDGKTFDAFISCAEDDKKWARDNLLYGIDKGQLDEHHQFGGQFSLYYEDRDAEPGRMKVGNSHDNMMLSRKVIIVLSKSYLKCSFLYFEMDLAINAMYNEDIEEVIVVYINRGLPKRKIPSELAKTMRRHELIEWSEEEDARELCKRQLIDRLGKRADAANEYTD